VQGCLVASFNGTALSIETAGHFDNSPINLDTSVPVSSLLEIHMAAYMTQLSKEKEFDLDHAVLRLNRRLHLEEEKTALRFLQLDHLLNHTSGLANVRSSRDIVRGASAMYVDSPSKMDPLSKIFTHTVTQIQSPGIVVVQNPMDYALAARIAEHKTKQSFRRQLRLFLEDYHITHDPFDYDFSTGFEQPGRNNRKARKAPKRYYHLYPSMMGRLTIREILLSIHELLFTGKGSDLFYEELLKARHTPFKYADSTCMPFRYRPLIDCYQMTAQGHGFTLNLVVDTNSQTVGLAVVNKESPQSEYLTGKLLRSSGIFPQLVESYPTEELSLSESQKEVLKGRYKTYRQSSLSYMHNFRLGGGLSIKEKRDDLFLTNLPKGYYSSSTKISHRHTLRPLLQDDERVVLGFDDGLHLAKVVVPSINKGSTIYSEIDGGSTLYLKMFSSSGFLIHARQNWNYYKTFKFIPRIKSTFTGLFNIRKVPTFTTTTSVTKTLAPTSASPVVEHAVTHELESGIATDEMVSKPEIVTPRPKHEEPIADLEEIIKPELDDPVDDQVEPAVQEETIHSKDEIQPKPAPTPLWQKVGKKIIFIPVYLLMLLRDLLTNLPSFSKPFAKRFFSDFRSFTVAFSSATWWVIKNVSTKLIVGSIAISSAIYSITLRGAVSSKPYYERLKKRLDFIGKPTGRRYGFLNHLRHYSKNARRSTYLYLFRKHPPMTVKALQAEKSTYRKYSTRAKKIELYNKKYPGKISLDWTGIGNLVLFTDYQFRKLRLKDRLTPRLNEVISSVLSPVIQTISVLKTYRRYSLSILVKQEIYRQERRATTAEKNNTLILPPQLEKYEEILREHNISNNDTLRKAGLRKLIAIPGIPTQDAKDLSRL
jgi:hypothetical protein